MFRKILKPLSTEMRIAWYSACVCCIVFAIVLLYRAGFTVDQASPALLMFAAVCSFVAALCLRLFFQQATTKEELVNHYFFRRKR
ncbi:MAG: hypothetical protein ACEQSE_03085 [Candidatus Aquirickettsiella gammari]